MMVSGGCQWVLCDGLGGVWSVRMESNSLIFANIRQYWLCFACLRTSATPDAAHDPARGIQGVWELVHTLGGLEHPEITRDYAGGSLWVVDSTFVVMGGRTRSVIENGARSWGAARRAAHARPIHLPPTYNQRCAVRVRSADRGAEDTRRGPPRRSWTAGRRWGGAR